MKQQDLFHRIAGPICSCCEPFQTTAERLSGLQAHSSPRFLNNSLSGYPQIAQCKQRNPSRRVLDQPFVAHLGETELALDDSKRVFHLGAHAGFHLLSLVQQTAPWRVLIQSPALAWAHCDMPLHCGGLSSLGRTLVTRIGKDDCFLTMQKAVSLGHIVGVGCGANDGVNHTGICIHSNVILNSKVPLVALLDLAHLRVRLTRAVLGGTGRCNQGGIDYGACFMHQTLASQGGVDGGHQQDTEVVVLEQVMEPQVGALIGHASHAGVQAGKQINN